MDPAGTLRGKQRFLEEVQVAGFRLIIALCLVLAGLLLFTTVACGSSRESDSTNLGERPDAPGTRLTVFAAASLTEAFTDVVREYELRRPEVEVVLNFDGSQRLRSQLEHGAQADIFASADWEQMAVLQDTGLLEGEPVTFVGNRLAFLVNRELAAGESAVATSAGLDTSPGPSALRAAARPGAKVILALPQVPAGRYADGTLELMENNPGYGPDLAEAIRANVVSRETNVRSVAHKVALGEADVGIAYVTDARPAFVAERVIVVELPEEVQIPVEYPIAATSPGGRDSGFIDFLVSEEGQEELKRHGFTAIETLRSAAP